MARWKYKVSIKELFNDETPPAEIGLEVAKRLRSTVPEALWDYDEELDDIIVAFENITGYENVTPTEEFDDILDRLYDWGDEEVEPFNQWPPNKRMWIG